jgi:hypothetical protein
MAVVAPSGPSDDLDLYVPILQAPAGGAHCWIRHRGLRLASSALREPMTRRFVSAIESFAKREDIDLLRFDEHRRTEDVAETYLAKLQLREGILLIGESREKTSRRPPKAACSPAPALTSGSGLGAPGRRLARPRRRTILRPMRRGLTVLAVLAVLATACGAPAAGPRGGRDAPPRASGEGACGPHEAPLGGTCWSAEGTRWRVRADGPGGAYRFDVELLAAGRVRATDHDAASPATDEWFQDGDRLRIFLSDRFVEYRARVTNGTVLIGEARNVRGQRWSWRADRDFGEAPCEASEARLEGACMTVAGTRWRLEPEGGEARLVEFLAGGRLGTGGREDDAEAAGAWEQEGPRLSFTLEAPSERRFEARLTDDASLSGTFRGDARAGRFTATRVESIPPVIHR